MMSLKPWLTCLRLSSCMQDLSSTAVRTGTDLGEQYHAGCLYKIKEHHWCTIMTAVNAAYSWEMFSALNIGSKTPF